MIGEQRDNARLPRACTVTVEIVSASHDGNGSAELVACVSGDLSRDGVCLRLPRELAPGAVHHLTVDYFNDEPPLQLTGEVRWCHPVADEPGRWDAGLALYNCRGTDAAAWEHLLSVLDRQAV